MIPATRVLRLIADANYAVSPPPFVPPDPDSALAAAKIFAREVREYIAAELRWEDDGGR